MLVLGKEGSQGVCITCKVNLFTQIHTLSASKAELGIGYGSLACAGVMNSVAHPNVKQ